MGAGAGGHVEGRSRRTGLWMKKLEDTLREGAEGLVFGFRSRRTGLLSAKAGGHAGGRSRRKGFWEQGHEDMEQKDSSFSAGLGGHFAGRSRRTDLWVQEQENTLRGEAGGQVFGFMSRRHVEVRRRRKDSGCRSRRIR